MKIVHIQYVRFFLLYNSNFNFRYLRFASMNKVAENAYYLCDCCYCDILSLRIFRGAQKSFGCIEWSELQAIKRVCTLLLLFSFVRMQSNKNLYIRIPCMQFMEYACMRTRVVFSLFHVQFN